MDPERKDYKNRRRQTNLLLGRPKNSGPFEKCPARSWSRVRKLEANGDGSHGADGHICHICQCKKTAGQGTGHLGFGLCAAHEKASRYIRVKDQIAEDHKKALQGHHPFAYRDTNQWLAQIQHEASRATNFLQLDSEIELVRATIQELLDKCRLDEKTRSPVVQGLLDELKGTRIAIETHVTEFTRDFAQNQVIPVLRRIETLCACPLTETSHGRQVPASDVTRMETIRKLSETVAKLLTSRMKMNEHEFCRKEEVVVFFAAVASATKRVFNDQAKYQEWVRAVIEIPQPKAMRSESLKGQATT